jgi:hypothetical protein
LQEINENFIEMLWHMVNKNIQKEGNQEIQRQQT